MLRPLLLLCWAATIVSAGDLRNGIVNDTSVPTDPIGHSAAANPQSTPVSNVETSPRPVASKKDERTTNESTEVPAAVTPSPTKPPTTAKPTTTKPITTPAPHTTTAPAPPTPLPPPSLGKWNVTQNNTLCILVQMAVQFNVSYTTANNMTRYRVMDLPANSTTTTGECGKTEQNLTLSWPSPNESIQNNFTIHFIKNETKKDYTLHHFEISLAAAEFPNAKINRTLTVEHVTPQFTTGLTNSYRCIKEQQLDLSIQRTNVTVGLLKVTKLQFQAFRGDNSTIFGLAKDCSFDTPDIVPITVGCALAGLVVIVLIAYLVGRRRSQARGYLSM